MAFSWWWVDDPAWQVLAVVNLNPDYEECRAEFEAWFRAEGLARQYESDMWYAFRACWNIRRSLEAKHKQTAMDKGN